VDQKKNQEDHLNILTTPTLEVKLHQQFKRKLLLPCKLRKSICKTWV